MLRLARPRLCRWAGLLLLAPPVLWTLGVSLMPTGWARTRLVAALERETAREVRLDDVRLGLFGGLHLRGLSVAEPREPDDPWLKADSITIDVNAAELLAGRLAPRRVEVQGVSLRVRRGADGNFEIGDLFRRSPKAGPDPAAGRDPEPTDQGVALRLTDARVELIDEPTGTRLGFTDLEGRGTWRRHRTILHELRGRCNGGPVLLEAELERGSGSPMFEGELHARHVRVGEGMTALHYVAPVLSGASVGLDGQLDLNLYLRGQGSTADELARSLTGRGAIRIDPIALDHSHVLAELGRVLTLPDGARVGSFGGTFDVARRRVTSKDLTLELAGLPIVLDGATSFDGAVDYRIRSEGLADSFSRELRSVLEDLPVRVDDVLDLRLRGTAGHYELTLDGLPVAGRDGRPLSDKERLREAARRLRDRLIR